MGYACCIRIPADNLISPCRLGEGTVDLLKRLKREIDPDNIMNPGKLVDAWD